MTSLERSLNELRLAGLNFVIDPDEKPEDVPVAHLLGRSVAQLLNVFAEQGHSGSTAPMAASIFYRLVRGEVLSPLTGKPEEWMDVSGSSGRPCFQNKRCFAIFADDENGKNAYNIHGRIFINKNEASFSDSKHSSTPVTFPCMPITEYIREGTPEAVEFKDVFKEAEDASARAQKE